MRGKSRTCSRGAALLFYYSQRWFECTSTLSLFGCTVSATTLMAMMMHTRRRTHTGAPHRLTTATSACACSKSNNTLHHFGFLWQLSTDRARTAQFPCPEKATFHCLQCSFSGASHAVPPLPHFLIGVTDIACSCCDSPPSHYSLPLSLPLSFPVSS